MRRIHPPPSGLVMVFQSYAHFLHMSVRKSTVFPMRMAKMSKEEQNKRIESAAKALNPTGRLNATPRKCLGWNAPAEVFREKTMEETGRSPYPQKH